MATCEKRGQLNPCHSGLYIGSCIPKCSIGEREGKSLVCVSEQMRQGGLSFQKKNNIQLPVFLGDGDPSQPP